MKERNLHGQSGVPTSGAEVVEGTPGKRTRAERLVYGGARVAERFAPAQTMGNAGQAGNAQAGGGGDVENPLAGDGAVQNAPGKPRVSVAFTESAAPPLTFNAKDYKDLYGQVSARVGKEAGSVTITPSLDTKTDADGNVVQADFTYTLATMVPEWPQKGTQPAADQAKFNAWRQSVVDHEKGHRDLYKRELAKLKAQVIGPKQSDVDSQETAVEAAAETAQDAFDASNQPAPLAAPGGIEHVGNAAGQPDASEAGNDQPPSDTATA